MSPPVRQKAGPAGGSVPGHRGTSATETAFRAEAPFAKTHFKPSCTAQESLAHAKDLPMPHTGIPPYIRTLCRLFLGTLAVLLAARLAMLVLLWPAIHINPGSDIAYAFYVGAKFDIRMVVLFLTPLALILGIPQLERLLARSLLRRLLVLLYSLIFFGAVFIYVVDFGWYFYMNQRIDATLLEFAGNPAISGRMVWESYPVPLIAAGMLVLTLLYGFFMAKTLNRHARIWLASGTGDTSGPRLGRLRRAVWSVLTFVGLFLLAYGQLSSNLFPLRWSNAYFSTDRNLATLALNPMQNLRDTLNSAHGTRPDVAATRESYDRMAAWLRVTSPNRETLDFRRRVPAAPGSGKPLNVVVIIMESLSWAKTSFAPGFPGETETPTPNILKLSESARYYPLFFSPTRTTARAIFTTMTGLPDINRSGGTSSRNQALVDQALLINQFKGYEKFYMIGGSASWANIRGLLEHNVDNLHLLEEGSWKAPNVDVWGISDLALLRESVAVFNAQTRPFVAVIQTAGYHRPYTIPEDNAGFVQRTPSEAEMKHYGFTGVDEYNSMRFSDHALGEFFRLASREPWFRNTVFAVFGDHGLTDIPGNVTPGYLACDLPGYHVPMLLYAPGLHELGLFENGVDPRPCGQPDIFPTLASLAGIPYIYNALGRDLLHPDTARDPREFLGGSSEKTIRLVEDGYCYIRDEAEGLYKLDDPELHNLLESEPERAARMRQEAQDTYTAGKYLLYHNEKAAVQPSHP